MIGLVGFTKDRRVTTETVTHETVLRSAQLYHAGMR